VSPYFPDTFRQLGKRLEFTTIKRPRQIPLAVAEYLHPIFAAENDKLSELIGVRFREWDSLDSKTCSAGGGRGNP
jgi:hypothetical protein